MGRASLAIRDGWAAEKMCGGNGSAVEKRQLGAECGSLGFGFGAGFLMNGVDVVLEQLAQRKGSAGIGIVFNVVDTPEAVLGDEGDGKLASRIF